MIREPNLQTTTEQAVNYDRLLWVGRLDNGEHFRIKKNSRKWYTVHAQCVEQVDDGSGNSGQGEFYTVAVSDKRMYAFHYNTKVYSPYP